MAKSFLERLGLVESEEPEIQSESVEIDELTLEEPQVQAEVPEGDTISVSDIYCANGLNDSDAISVYKIQSMLNSLPSEMPNKTKKSTLKSLMTTLGYNTEMIRIDAENRISVLESASDQKIKTLQEEINQNAQQVEAMKIEIERLTARNNDASIAIHNISSTVSNETSVINGILEFIKEDE